MSLRERFQSAWKLFRNNRDPTGYQNLGVGSSIPPTRPRVTRGNERSIVSAIYNRIAVDVASVAIRHVRLDEKGQFLEYIDSGLDNVLTTEANIDQSGRDFIQDIVMTLCDDGAAALVPTVDDDNIMTHGSFEIYEMRVGKIIHWWPKNVQVRLYNDITGEKQEYILPKESIGIVYNPFYSVMNEPSSTLQRLLRKLILLDAVDEQTSSGKLNMIIQLPYSINSDTRKKRADARQKDIEMQLTSSKYGMAYIDSTEKITQLNRPLENNLLEQIEYLTGLLYSQLGIPQEIFAGTADSQTRANYNACTIEPFLSSITNEMRRKFLTKTARSQRQTIMFFKEPFKLATPEEIATIADTFVRNEILSPNDLRGIIGYKPDNNPKSDELRNRNMPIADTGGYMEEPMPEEEQYPPEPEPIYQEPVYDQSYPADPNQYYMPYE